ncbi:MAG: hypothetical protein AUJ07_02150 [Crenarchaeota archaeon 13_1_40CM_3_53_5]|nr:MAG: hypothetical protein AUJ07_02150 [Crenarchaeota archaeon 13_1_40CM_3_53_5]
MPRIHSAAAASPFTVDLDADSTSQTDTVVTTSASSPSTFKVGAVLQATPPAIGQTLTAYASFKYVDANTNGVWDNGEMVVNDANANGVYDLGERVIAGPTPTPGTVLSSDPNIRFIDDNANSAWDFPEVVVYDTNNNNIYNLGERLIAPNIFGWQFAINYDPTFLVPQADPGPLCTLYPDCASGPISLGAASTGCPVYGGGPTGGCNWNACPSGCGALVSSVPTPGKIFAAFTYLLPHGGVFVNTKVLLANVAFEIISKPASPLSLTISDVLFSDQNGFTLPNISAGAGVTETITNDPPHASFTVTKVSTYVFSFDASGSTDSDGTIANPAGYFWDFGDGTQDLGSTGPVVQHDYSTTCTAPCDLTATLRVVDDLGATGAARDGSGSPIVDIQPSHTSHSVLVDIPPTAAFTFAPSNPAPGNTVSFDAATSTDPDGIISSYDWDFNDGSPFGSGVIVTHAFSLAGTYHVKLNVTDDAGLKDTLMINVIVATPHQPPVVTVTLPTTTIHAGTTTTIQLSATATTGTITTIKINWGDGTNEETLAATATSASHTYANPGNYSITVTATDDSGATTPKSATLTIEAAAQPPPQNNSTLILGIAAVSLVAILAAALVMLRRRRKPSGTETKPGQTQ